MNGFPVTRWVIPLLFLGLASAGLAESNPPSGWLGVLLGEPGEPREGSGPLSGVPISGVVRDSPAERARLRAQDRILAVDGVAVRTPKELVNLVGRMEAGRWVSLTVDRDGDELQLSARLIERPADRRELRVRSGWIGSLAIDLPAKLREHFGAPEDAGAMISEVLPGSPAEAAGLEIGDVVFEIDGRPVRSVGELDRQVSTAGVGNVVEIVLVRNGAEITLEATVAETPEDNAGKVRKRR
jgi:serine protease Do